MEYRFEKSSRTFLAEQTTLSHVLRTIDEGLNRLLTRDRQPVSGANDIAVYEAVARGEQKWFEEWDRHRSSPYYGRLEYIDHDENDVMEVVYVSKSQRSLSFRDGKDRVINVIPWNAPVAKMYITHRSVPNIWDLKRVTRLVIQAATLDEVTDLYRDANLPDLGDLGEFIESKMFEKSSGGKLADIVATLQEEQYDLIVQPMRQSLVINGGPGSGKTEIALHRVVHLLHSQSLTAKQILYLGPSAPFLRYVSDILPSLDATDIVLHDLGAWVSAYAGLPVRPQILYQEESKLYDLGFVEFVDRWFKEYLEEVALKLGPLEMEFNVDRMSGKQTRVASLLCEDVARLLASAKSLSHGVQLLRERWTSVVETVLVGSESHEFQTAMSQARQRFAAWLATSHLPRDINDVAPLYSTVRKQVGLSSPFSLQGTWGIADALGLLYLSTKIFSPKQRYALIVLDEAQDLPAIGFALVRQLLTANGSLTVVGDPYQHLTDFSQPLSWETLAQQLQARYIVLKDNYRSRAKVVQLANAAHPAGIEQRPRRPGGIIHPPYSLGHHAAEKLIHEVERLVSRYSGQVALIFANKIPHQLREELFALQPEQLKMAVEPADPEGYQVIISTVKYAKGLEFDAAILVAESATAFELVLGGAYQLYTAISRAREEVMMFGLGHMPRHYQTLYESVSHV
ncbi:UvrD-helicase domain-containing protein [Sulfobacillus thermosulfidooxidans]|uniref:UvrD-helicase domain-containing protein n=1 Tax=Sulfobacillus thermosulfidooxidans TaxID=28034 RepID=UPI0003FDFF91|nr:UvrD-helicase domain-containing protein [Sulfobacillus thermosulfidooxidans]